MTAPPDDTTTDLHAVIAALRAERDAALAREAALAEELAAQARATRTAELADRNTEFGERIEHQAATIDVLKAMSASPGDAQPVFDLIVRRAAELCNAQSGGLFEYDGERVHIGTIHGLYEHDGKLLHVQSLHGTEPNIAPASLAAYLRQFPMRPKRGSITMRAIWIARSCTSGTCGRRPIYWKMCKGSATGRRSPCHCFGMQEHRRHRDGRS